MADLKLTDISAFSDTLDAADLIHIVDVSDTSQDPAGSSYKLTIAQLQSGITTIYNGDGTLSGNRIVDLDSNTLKFINGSVGFNMDAAGVFIVAADTGDTGSFFATNAANNQAVYYGFAVNALGNGQRTGYRANISGNYTGNKTGYELEITGSSSATAISGTTHDIQATATTIYGTHSTIIGGTTSHGVAVTVSSITDGYGFKAAVTGATNNWGIYIDAAKNYLTGKVGIGTSTIDALLHVKGSGATSSTYTAQFHNSTGSNNSLLISDEGISGFGIVPLSTVRVTIKAPSGGYSLSAKNSTETASMNVDDAGNLNVGVSAVFTDARVRTYNSNTSQFFSFIGENLVGNGTTGIRLNTGTNNMTAIYNIGASYSAIHTDYQSSTLFSSNGLNSLGRGINFVVNSTGIAANDAFRIIGDDGSLSLGFAGTLFSVSYNKISIPLLQVGNAGLSSGDCYFDTAANALANGDKILIRKV